MMTDENLNMIFVRKSDLKFDEKDGHIRVIKEQKHWSQRFLRKLGVKIPEQSYTELDDYGSLVFREIDGRQSVKIIGAKLAEQFDEAGEQLYERLLIFLQHMENVEQWIELK